MIGFLSFLRGDRILDVVIHSMVQAVDGALGMFDEAEQRAITAYLQRVLEVHRAYADAEGRD